MQLFFLIFEFNYIFLWISKHTLIWFLFRSNTIEFQENFFLLFLNS